ncbi:MAG: hypothetical protein KatS3mg034_1390 [Vicingaceae bacterium]|nr:MAG: hypothetical protein KatS3mg034_1390 [Vicingaceae bacterium]
MKHGPFVTFYTGGQKAVEGFYTRGYKDSVWTEYFENGKIQKQYTFHLDTLDGEYKEWYPNGQLKSIVLYKKGGGVSFIFFFAGWESIVK